MGSKAMARVEALIRDVCADLEVLRQRIEALEAGTRPCSREEIVAFLDQFRAGEVLGAEAFGVWAAATSDEALRGSLRVIQLRESGHSRLLEERLKELGGSPRFRYPDDALSHEFYGARDRSDAEKLRAFLALAPPEKVLPELDRAVARLSADPESQALVCAIARDERATLELLQEECERRAA